MSGRQSFAYVVSVKGPYITLNLKDSHKGHYASYREGVSSVSEIGNLIGVDGGTRLLILRIRSLSFTEPREAHKARISSTMVHGEPLRNLEAVVVGAILRHENILRFHTDSLLSPTLGAEAFPLSKIELESVFNSVLDCERALFVGKDIRNDIPLKVSLQKLLGQHVAVLGGTGQGKSCFTASVLQQILEIPRSRIVVFDINGEYEQALKPHVNKKLLKVTTLGGPNPTFRIPFVALGRHGLGRLLLPSEKTQRPALNFALERLPYVAWFPEDEGVGLVDENSATLFDDCRPDVSECAKEALDTLRSKSANMANSWPHMRALGCLAAESYCLVEGRYGIERNSFNYGHVAPLVNRIRRYTEDPMFTSVIGVESDCTSQSAKNVSELNWQNESSKLVDKIFGTIDSKRKLHIVNLRNVAHDLLPIILGSLLELLAFERFRRGQDHSFPILLVLEEAHHYLRQWSVDGEDRRDLLAYERLAKEGRKFGVSLWLSTQRPSEVSPTVLAQAGTWVAFRLTSEVDLRAISTAGEWIDKLELDRIAGLSRQNAIIFGNSVAMPVLVEAPEANPIPKSTDPDFSAWEETVKGCDELEIF